MLEKRRQTDLILRQERVKKINERAISDGFVSSELLGQFKYASNNGGGGSVGRESGKKLSTDAEKSQDNQERVFGENGDRGRGMTSKYANKKEEAPIKNSVLRPVGNAIQSASSIKSIIENSQNIKRERLYLRVFVKKCDYFVTLNSCKHKILY